MMNSCKTKRVNREEDQNYFNVSDADEILRCFETKEKALHVFGVGKPEVRKRDHVTSQELGETLEGSQLAG